ncbi:MAG: phosphodiester glycosidase family protein [Bacteroidales bacterium]|nr:phosphodiester glycosidase family protein [Bacteroidales bacterium]MBN2758620.1 phosphodiester glycosidase family protein [Bacteroidales bacterium]
MTYNKTTKEFNLFLENQQINTWFDLGLFIDKFKETKLSKQELLNDNYDTFKQKLSKKGIAFVSFYFSIDGVTIEVEKYAKIFKNLLNNIQIHYVAGEIYPKAEQLIEKNSKLLLIKNANGFDDWDLYNDFFNNKLSRGSKKYNETIVLFWKQVKQISLDLSAYIEKNDISLLYLLNICSNPGNVSLCLATILVSEFFGIPVINNCHDYYWEGGNNEFDKKVKKLPDGPRDFFFTNYHIGEIFSQIEVLYPWESRIWLTLNINRKQSDYVINIKGQNPANVCEIGTAVDTEEYSNISKRNKFNTLIQFEKIFCRNSDKLVAYSVDGVISNELVDISNPQPILIGNQTKVFSNFVDENIILLQPTRIVSRKRIEVGFRLIKKLFDNKKFLKKFYESPHLKLTLLVTGPIPPGQGEYFKKLILRFQELIKSLPQEKASRIHLGFMFSEFDKKAFRAKFEDPIGIPELFNIASLILLPSKTEGRGLPIIESTASGVPIFCRRYFPENVYAEVIGEHLPENDRLKVIEFDGKEIKSTHLHDITERIFFPHMYIAEIEHNKRVVKKRFSLTSLRENIEEILYKLYLQISDNTKLEGKVESTFKQYEKLNKKDCKLVNKLVDTENRYFMQGYGKLAFMLYLKSLIDPSYFRVEQQKIRGRSMEFAKNLVQEDIFYKDIDIIKIHQFYNAVDTIFKINDGEEKIRHDHSFAYRHRNKKWFPYYDYTLQELTGIINLLHEEIIEPDYVLEIDQSSHFFTNWNLALSQLTSSDFVAIDDRTILKQKLCKNVPIAYFPGRFVKYELEIFVLQSVRNKLNISVEKQFTEKILKDNIDKLSTIYIFAQEKSLAKWSRANDIKKYILEGSDSDLKLLYNFGIIKLIETTQLSVGINIKQLGDKALKTLIKIKNQNGFIITTRRNSALMTDILEIDKFHIGNVGTELASNILGIPINSGYIQFVPAGLRTTLAYPTPTQNAKQFSDALNSDLFMYLSNHYGEEYIYNKLNEDAKLNGNPINEVLKSLQNKKKKDKILYSNQITGLHKDGLPYSGAYARLNLNKDKEFTFNIVSSLDGTKTVKEFVSEFEKNNKKTVRLAWNGGYILNPELVGKLVLPESFIGANLGLIISYGKLLSPPLFNKAALLVDNQNNIQIKLVNSKQGFILKFNKKEYIFDKKNYNSDNLKENDFGYYDLLYKNDFIFADERTIVRLSGNTVIEIIETKKNEELALYPVGLSLSFRKELLPNDLRIGDKLELIFEEFKDIIQAVEAGPMLITKGKIAIDMENEGWTTKNSIKTQAARLDYLDMRGPKIAVGIDKSGNLIVLTVNGRIRESVGATHIDMAEILIKYDIVTAMGFDPGGSSTLFVDGKILNISPYNPDYEDNKYSLPATPRAVANAVLIFK